MSGSEGSEYATPIPLRRNEFDTRPNCWTRLEALEVPRQRMHALVSFLDKVTRPPDPNGLAGVLVILSKQVDTCMQGDLAAVEDVRDGTADLPEWLTAVEGVLFPRGVPSSAQADVEDQRR